MDSTAGTKISNGRDAGMASGKRWKRKARAFRVLSAFPFGDELHYWLQRSVTRTLPVSPAVLQDYVHIAERRLAFFQRHAGGDLRQAYFLEFGAGRDLAGPLALAYSGVGRVIAIDISRLAKLSLVRHAAAHIAVAQGYTIPHLKDWDHLPAATRVEYRAPADARATGLPDASVDCVTSFHTLQHIPRADIAAILRETRRILKPTGLAVMRVHYEDMYSLADRSISPFNFLTYSDEEWAPYDSRLQYQNRMRHGEYLALFRQEGYEILEEEVDRVEPDLELAARLAPRFRAMDLADVFATKAYIVARPV